MLLNHFANASAIINSALNNRKVLIPESTTRYRKDSDEGPSRSPLHSCTDGKCYIWQTKGFLHQILPEVQTVITFWWFWKLWNLPLPQLISAVHYYTTDAGSVPANPLGSRFYHNVGAMFQRPEKIAGSSKCIINKSAVSLFFTKLANFQSLEYSVLDYQWSLYKSLWFYHQCIVWKLSGLSRSANLYFNSNL